MKYTKEELTEIYNKTNGQARELFFAQLEHFRKIMCSTAFTLERKDKEFECLASAYLRCQLKDEDINIFISMTDEWNRRRLYEELQ
jgi:hypothetical protein